MASKQTKQQYCYTIRINESRNGSAYIFAHNPEEARAIAADRYKRSGLECFTIEGRTMELSATRTEEQVAKRVGKVERARTDLNSMVESGHLHGLSLYIIRAIQTVLNDIEDGKISSTNCQDVMEWFANHGFCVASDGIGWIIEV